VQQLGQEGFGVGVVVDGVEVCLARQGSSHAADGVFDGSLLPGTVRITEEGPDAELVDEDVVLSELGTEPGEELLGCKLRSFTGLLCQQMRRDLRSWATRIDWPAWRRRAIV
jgi:hypothetical protein